jgi:anaerobic selenocysteine-containing dehydrogenase
VPDTASRTIVHSACPHDCPSTCALEVEKLDSHHIGRIRGASANNYTSGVVCEKVARYAERVHHPDRLSQPLKRKGAKGGGEFTPLSWESALDEVAERFMRAAQRLGTETVWPLFYAGTMGLVQRDGIDRLRHVMRYSRQQSTICTALVDAGWLAGVGAKMGPDPREMGDADLIIVWGGNPASTQVNAMTHIARARRERNAQLIVVDPYRSSTAKVADTHLMLKPGTDGALACAIMHIMFRDGHADREYMRRHADVPDELEKHLASRTPQWAAAITGLPVAQIETAAKLYGTTQRAFIRVGYGFSRSRNGAASVHAVSCLATVGGKWLHKGGGTFYSNGDIYKINDTLIKGTDCLDTSIRMLDMSRVGPILTGDKTDLGDGPPVTAMLVQNMNPAVVCPDSKAVRAGFMRDDLFLCVHEQFMTDTAKLADMVLPATTFLEHDDMYRAGGHSFFQVTRKVIEPYAEARENHYVICELAKRLGATHRGFDMTAWEIIDESLKLSGYPDAATLHREHWIDRQPDFDEAHFSTGFPTSDGKFHFKPDWQARGKYHAQMPTLPDYMGSEERADETHPFRLVTSPARSYLNSTFTETPTSQKREQKPTVLIHSDDCKVLGIATGERVQVGNARNTIIVHAKAFDGVQRGVIVIESIWPNSAFEGGIGVNSLIGADPGAPNGGAVFHDSAVWVRRVD